MPHEWGALAATTASFLGAKVASQAFGDVWREKVTPQVFEKSDLAHELTRVYAQAFDAFVTSLRMVFHVDDEEEARLREMFEDAGVQALLHEMPFVPFAQLDTARARRLFGELVAIPSADDDDFKFAWKALKRGFDEAVAQTTQARRLVDAAGAERREALLEEIAARFRPRVRDDTAVLAEYRRYVDKLYRLADTRGLFWREKEATGEEIRLADVFVETLLQRQDLRLKEALEDDEGRGEDAERPVYRETREEPRAVADVLGRERRLVILGPPGSGKSTLARCLALALATEDEPPMETGLPDETVPLLLALKTYAARLRNDSGLKLDVFLKEELGSQLPNLDEILAGGSALVLLDGLDEVFDEAHRRWVSDEVWRLMSLYGEARFVLTSRPQGYRAAPLPGSVPLYEMVPFDDERIGRFFRGWFVTLARQGYEREREPTPEERAADLTEDVLGRPRIRSLAENPMLCTLIVLVNRSRSGRLPERRVKFYEAAVAVLAEHWEKAKRSPKQEVALDFPEPELMVGVLAEVAWKTQTELGGREIPEDVLETWMRDALADDPEWGGKHQRAVRDLLKVIQERTGLLVDAGGGRYQFVHLSLQEYLVAFYLLDRLDDRQCCSVVRYFMHAPEWEEILRLAIGGASRVRADALVRAILDGEPTSEWEEIIRRDLRFVCRCFSDRPNVSEGVRGDVRSRWLALLAEPSYDDEAGLIDDGLGLGLTPETHAAVESRLMNPYSASLRRATVEYFASDGETRAAFEAHLADENWSVRRIAVQYFAELGTSDEKMRAAIEARLADDSPIVRRAAVEYFAKLGELDDEMRAAVEARLADAEILVRRAAVEYFAKSGGWHEKTRATFEPWLADHDPIVRGAAVEYFAKSGTSDEKTRAAFEAWLTDDNPYVRRSAVNWFAKLGASDGKTRDAVKARLADHDPYVRISAVEYFAKLGASDEKTRAAVEARIADHHSQVRAAVIEYFAEFGTSDEKTRAAVEVRLAKDHWSVQEAAVGYFSRLGVSDEKTRVAVEAHLVGTGPFVQAAAITFFVETGLGDRGGVVLDAFAKGLVWTSISEETRLKLSVAIGRLAATDDVLLQRITKDRIVAFSHSRALAAAALRRDEMRRAATPLAAVLGTSSDVGEGQG